MNNFYYNDHVRLNSTVLTDAWFSKNDDDADTAGEMVVRFRDSGVYRCYYPFDEEVFGELFQNDVGRGRYGSAGAFYNYDIKGKFTSWEISEPDAILPWSEYRDEDVLDAPESFDEPVKVLIQHGKDVADGNPLADMLKADVEAVVEAKENNEGWSAGTVIKDTGSDDGGISTGTFTGSLDVKTTDEFPEFSEPAMFTDGDEPDDAVVDAVVELIDAALKVAAILYGNTDED